MKNENVFIVIIIMVGLIVCAWLLADGMKSLGRSIEGAGLSMGQGLSSSGKSPQTLKVDLGKIDLKVDGNSSGGGAFRIETTAK